MSVRRIGLIGGISWASTESYHRRINQRVHDRLGGQANAPMIIWSVDFVEVEARQRAGEWTALAEMFAAVAATLEAAGAQAIGICANTMHLVAPDVAAAVSVPLLDMVELTAQACAERGLATVGLLGTAYTMASDMFPRRLEAHGVDALLPAPADRDAVQQLIYGELTHGEVTDTGRRTLLGIIDRLVTAGAEAVVLACTELELLVHDGDAAVPLLDTTEIHADALADFVLGTPAPIPAALEGASR